jgi:hypothetical protein
VLSTTKNENGDFKRGVDPLAEVGTVGATPCGRPYRRLTFGGDISLPPQGEYKTRPYNFSNNA